MFVYYWPTALPSESGVATNEQGVKFTVPTSVTNVHGEVARKMNSYRKIVFSKTLREASWNNSVLVREIDPTEITILKEKPGKDMLILGSASIAPIFTRLNLIDEYRLWVNPIILGGGLPLFGILPERRKLKLIDVKRFSSGLLSLTYRGYS